MTDYGEALKELRKVHEWLASISDAAASSLDEGFEELLTVNEKYRDSHLFFGSEQQ